MQAVSGALLLTLNPKMQQLLLMITMMMNTRLRSMVPRTTLMMLVTTKLKNADDVGHNIDGDKGC